MKFFYDGKEVAVLQYVAGKFDYDRKTDVVGVVVVWKYHGHPAVTPFLILLRELSVKS